MSEKIAKIDRVFLGIEGHGIMTCLVSLDYGGSGQTVGGYALDEPRHEGDEFVGRFGTAFGMEWIARLMRAAGVSDFAKIQGRTVLALTDGDAYGATVIGLAPLPTERGEPFLFRELAEEYHPALAGGEG
jgi:hypothetical protein